MKTQKGINQRGFAGPIRPEQSDGAALQNACETVKNRAAAELHFEPVELNRWGHHLQFITDEWARMFHALRDRANEITSEGPD